ncbi:MAG: right-handed parallel beta-helix repeat-containing protein [Anaerolineales bacterium]
MKSVLRVSATLAIIFILLFTTLPVRAESKGQAVFNSIRLVPNIETIGVAVSGTELPATAELFYRKSGETEWRNAHPLVRIKDGRLVGSLFNLQPATNYEVFAFNGAALIKGSVTTQPDQLSFTPTATLYVDANTLPGGDGSDVSPLQTIQEAVNRAKPGTQILVADGVYREAVTFPASGTPGNWIQVKAQGEAAILDSAAYLSGDIWRRDTADNIWSTVPNVPVYYLARDGARFYQYEDKDGLIASTGHNETPVKEGWFFEPSGKLYVRSSDNPSNHTWQVPRLNRAFNIVGKDWIWIEGFGIQYYTTSTNGCGICTLNASHIVIRNNEIRNAQIGIYTEWTGSDAQGNDTRIEGNNVADPKDEWPWDAVKGTRMEGTAILVRGHTGTIVRDNIVHDYFNGIFTGSSGAGISEYGEVAFDVDVYHNYIHHIADDAIEAEGACVNHRFRNNTVDQSYVGISIAPVTLGPTWVLRSTFTNHTDRGIKFDSNSSGFVFFYQNTFWSNRSNVSEADLISPVSNVTMRNNIFQGAGYSIHEVKKDPLYNDWNYNNWYSSLIPPIQWENVNYYTVAEFCAARGMECNGFDDFPGLADPINGDFKLLPSSLNIDRGVPIPGINDEFVGDAPDLGAFEYPMDLPPAVIGSTRADPNPTKADMATFKVTFSNRVSGVDLVPPFKDFRLISNISGAAITDITRVTESTYTVRVNTGKGNGILRLDILDDDSITDIAGNPLGGVGAGNGNFTKGETYLINRSITTVKTTVFQSQPGYDGWILELGENTSVGGKFDKSAATFFVGDNEKNEQYKGILSFDTSPLPNKAVILQVQLKVRQSGIEGNDPFSTHGKLLAEIRKDVFGTNATLQIGDFSAEASRGSALDTFTGLTPGWYVTELRNVNLTFIDKAGTTQFRLSFSKDDNDDLDADYVKFFSGNSQPGTMPQLIVTYYVP